VRVTEKKKAVEAAEEQRGLKRGPGAAADGRPIKSAKPGLKSTSAAASNVVPDEYLPPNRILFLQNIPDDYEVEGLTAIFARFEGFREVRLVPGRRGIAFVEYDAEQGAIAAKESTSGMTLGEKNIKVTYQRQ
jgi:U2 small nuclear ribonucleoprotein B''